MLIRASFWAAPLLLAQANGGASAIDLRVLAQASPRPAPCASAGAGRGVWERARVPQVLEYCRELAHGYTLLAVSPREALVSAAHARSLLPAEVNPVVLAARSHVALGEYAKAWVLFAPLPLESDLLANSADALHDYARAATMAGDASRAERAYRRLMSRVDLMVDARRRLSATIEAAFAVLHTGEQGRAQALSYLQWAARHNDSTQFPQCVGGALRLVGEWGGRPVALAKHALDLVPDALETEFIGGPRNHRLVLTQADQAALMALILEHWDASDARDRWLSLAEDSPTWAQEASRRARHLSR